jgi:hypothetical protein
MKYPARALLCLLGGLCAYSYVHASDVVPTPTPAVDAPVTLVGLGTDGQEIVKTIPALDYSQSVAAVVNTVQGSITPTLEAEDVSTAVATPKWSLRTIAVGCTITSQIGLGPIWSISPSARLRIIFSNSTSPVYPD